MGRTKFPFQVARVQVAPSLRNSGTTALARHLESALVFTGHARKSAVVISDHRVFTQRVPGERRNWKPQLSHYSETRRARGPLVRVNNHILIHTGKISVEIERGILIAGPSHNWFHWVVEMLPTIHRLVNANEPWSGWPLIMRAEPLQKENFRALLDVVAPNNETIEAPTNSFFRVGSLVIGKPTSNPGSVDFRLFDSLPDSTQSWLDSMAFGQYRSRLLKEVLKQPPKTPIRRVFLTRREGANRHYNQAQLLEIAQPYGFVGINPDDYPLATLWSVLSQCEAVIGPQGAAWANTVVCPRGLVALQWSGGRLRGGLFKDLAHQLDMKLDTLVGNGDYDGEYSIPVNVFRKAMGRLFGPVGPP